MAHFGIKPEKPSRQLLDDVVAAFASLPYENITKIIKRAERGSAEKARRYPEEVIHDHILWGTGGTCFSLTSALLHLIRRLGWQSEYILADRHYGQDTHCAVLVWIGNIPHLLDPGFLILHPVPLPANREQEIETGFNSLILESAGEAGKVSLSTVRRGIKTYRLTYKTSPVDAGRFLRAWDASFGWDMMRYPLLTRTAGARQIYLRGSRLQISRTASAETHEIRGEDLIARIAAEFRIDPAVVSRAMSVLREKGEGHDQASGS
jgi:arylamine N-acetyltransferase